MRHPLIIDSAGRVRVLVVERYSFTYECAECGTRVPATHESEYDELPDGKDRRFRSSVVRTDAIAVVRGNETTWLCTTCRPSWHDRIVSDNDDD